MNVIKNQKEKFYEKSSFDFYYDSGYSTDNADSDVEDWLAETGL